jgi:hypothetical protein
MYNNSKLIEDHGHFSLPPYEIITIISIYMSGTVSFIIDYILRFVSNQWSIQTLMTLTL